MEYIAHRINTRAQLRELPREYGAELDLRDDLTGRIYIKHHPFEDGEDFEDYLKEYHHGTMILNIKSERIEHRILELLQKYQVKKYFFLDSSFPMIKMLSDLGERRIALRYSEYEGMDTLEAMAGKADWVWVDTFNRLPLDHKSFLHIKEMGYRLCLVSPELQGQPEKIAVFAEQMVCEKLRFDAICCKMDMMYRWGRSLKSFI